MHIEAPVWETSKEDIHVEDFKPKFKIGAGKKSHVSRQMYDGVAMAMQKGSHSLLAASHSDLLPSCCSIVTCSRKFATRNKAHN